jgi:hypothetical protein
MARQTETKDVRDIPLGYVPLASFEPHGHGKKGGQWYQRLYKAWAAKQLGGIRVILGGKRAQIFVNPVEVESLVEQWTKLDQQVPAASQPQSRLITDRQLESAIIAICEINNGITCMQATLERLTQAVESIATQPKKDEFSDFVSH